MTEFRTDQQMEEQGVEYPKGTIFCCPNCRKELFKTRRNFNCDEVVKTTDVEGLNGMQAIPFEPIVCNGCQRIFGVEHLRPKWFFENDDGGDNCRFTEEV